MNRHPRAWSAGCAAFATSLGFHGATLAEQFLNFGQMGAPGGVAFESFPTATRSGAETALQSNNILTYFSKTGFTGTRRDQLQFWVGATAGRSKAREGVGAVGSSWGISGPNIGAAYYYNIVQPTVCAGCEGYAIYTLAPIASLTLPTGSDDTTGFRAGSNSHSVYLGLSHFIKIGRWSLSANPLSLFYGGPSRTPTEIAPGRHARLRGGLSYTVADVAIGYDVTPDLAIGIRHAVQRNNQADSSFARSWRGQIGPAVAYTGFARHGLYLYANLNVDYRRSDRLQRATGLSLVVIKYL